MDIFCQFKEKFPSQIIKETDNFLLVHDGYPLAEGHLLLIPKKHTDCFLNLSREFDKEYKKLRAKVEDFLKNNYKKPIIFEHGIAGQTILHAHLHFLPTETSILPELMKQGRVLEKPAVPYLYYYENKEYYFAPYSIEPGFLHHEFAKKLKRPLSGPVRAKDLNSWVLSVKKKWKNG